jgi:hypothetical protein
MTRQEYKNALYAVLAAFLLAACGKGIEVATNSPQLKVSVSSCKGPSTPNRPPPLDKIRWIEAMTLEIRARGDMHCEADRVTAAYAVSRNNLELGYAGGFSPETAKKSPPACSCVREFVYVISNLEQHPYIINVENIPRDGTAKKWESRRLK